MTLPELSLRYIASFPAVTCSIPGARRVRQVEQNVEAGSKGPLDAGLLSALARLYATDGKPFVHQTLVTGRIRGAWLARRAPASRVSRIR